MAVAIGIDLGTAYSAMAVMEQGRVVVIPNREGERTTPSVVAFTRTGEVLVGAQARRQMALSPSSAVMGIKRYIGRRFDRVRTGDVSAPKFVEGPQGGVRVRVAPLGRELTPEELSALILQKLKRDAEAYLRAPVTSAVLTVPAHFDDAARRATAEAAALAGLEVLRLVNEPTAAALAYGLDRRSVETVLVFDLGGSTYDVSVLQVGEGVIEVQATAGDAYLGGDDYDERIVRWLVDQFRADQGLDLNEDAQALLRLREGAERAKIELSAVQEAEINLPFITADASGPRHLHARLTRARFEQLTADLTSRLRPPLERVLAEAHTQPEAVREVVLVGGAARMPQITAFLSSLLGTVQVHRELNPEEVVAIGAALQAGMLTGAMVPVANLDVTPLSLGIESQGGLMTVLIPRHTPLPVEKTELFSTAEDGQTVVDIHVLQGERAFAVDNLSLGRFRLEGLRPAPRGVPQIEIGFVVDAQGNLRVSARDRITGCGLQTDFPTATRLSRAEVEHMVREGQDHAAPDERARALALAREAAARAEHRALRYLDEPATQAREPERQAIERELQRLRIVASGDDAQAMAAAVLELQQSLYRLGRCVYAGAQTRVMENRSGRLEGRDETPVSQCDG
ncbi:MAG: molecular chaperone DnaK [Anaerolineae bacterium]